MELPLTSSGRRNHGEMGRVRVPALPAGMFVSFFSDGTLAAQLGAQVSLGRKATSHECNVGMFQRRQSRAAPPWTRRMSQGLPGWLGNMDAAASGAVRNRAKHKARRSMEACGCRPGTGRVALMLHLLKCAKIYNCTGLAARRAQTLQFSADNVCGQRMPPKLSRGSCVRRGGAGRPTVCGFRNPQTMPLPNRGLRRVLKAESSTSCTAYPLVVSTRGRREARPLHGRAHHRVLGQALPLPSGRPRACPRRRRAPCQPHRRKAWGSP